MSEKRKCLVINQGNHNLDIYMVKTEGSSISNIPLVCLAEQPIFLKKSRCQNTLVFSEAVFTLGILVGMPGTLGILASLYFTLSLYLLQLDPWSIPSLCMSCCIKKILLFSKTMHGNGCFWEIQSCFDWYILMPSVCSSGVAQILIIILSHPKLLKERKHNEMDPCIAAQSQSGLEMTKLWRQAVDKVLAKFMTFSKAWWHQLKFFSRYWWSLFWYKQQ